MSGFLQRLADRARGDAAIRPRLASLFEDPGHAAPAGDASPEIELFAEPSDRPEHRMATQRAASAEPGHAAPPPPRRRTATERTVVDAAATTPRAPDATRRRNAPPPHTADASRPRVSEPAREAQRVQRPAVPSAPQIVPAIVTPPHEPTPAPFAPERERATQPLEPARRRDAAAARGGPETVPQPHRVRSEAPAAAVVPRVERAPRERPVRPAQPSGETTIQISIGRIEVRASSEHAQRREPARSTVMSLGDYLQARAEHTRR
jgi:hypothetical protein